MSEVALAFLLALLAGLATAVGGALAVTKRRFSPGFMAGSLGLSAGVMLYVSFMEMLPIAIDTLTDLHGEQGEWWALAWFFAGIILIAVIDRLVPPSIHPRDISDTDRIVTRDRAKMLRTGLFTAGALALHNFPEGFAVFLAATQEPAIAIPVVVAVAIHNVPEGIAVAVPVTYATGSRAKGFAYALLAGLAEPLGALAGYLVLRAFLGPEAMAFAFAAVAGIMVFVALDELLPAAHRFDRHHVAIYGLLGGMGIMAVSLAAL
ncbi:MAG: zinc transporter ZupT [Mobilicoccus sp.]|nr:zinc transporter ZupT [Mobilicoccus sp.]